MADSSALPAAGAPGSSGAPVIEVEFCGDRSVITTGGPYGLGRDTDLVLDTPATMPAELVRLDTAHGMWFVRQLTDGAEVSLLVGDHGIEAKLGPGRAAPIVFARSTIRIETSRTPYEVEVRVAEPLFAPLAGRPALVRELFGRPGAASRDADGANAAAGHGVGGRDGGRLPRVLASLNHEQRVLVTVLAAPVLRRGIGALSEIPSSVEAARMLEWPVTKFNRKLDTVCGKLARAGIDGLHGGDKRPALNRRTRLVQEVVRHGIVTADDLALLQQYPAVRGDEDGGPMIDLG